MPGKSVLKKDHVAYVCRLGQGTAVCAFLLMGPDGYECGKGSDMEHVLRDRIRRKEMGAQGDNCSGPPEFKHVG